jgi:hypothetical protein
VQDKKSDRHGFGRTARIRDAGDKRLRAVVEAGGEILPGRHRTKTPPERPPFTIARATLNSLLRLRHTSFSFYNTPSLAPVYIAIHRLICTYDLLVARSHLRVTPIRAPWTLKTKGSKNCLLSRLSTPSCSSTRTIHLPPRYIFLSTPRILSPCASRQRHHPLHRTRRMDTSSSRRFRTISMEPTLSSISRLSS